MKMNILSKRVLLIVLILKLVFVTIACDKQDNPDLQETDSLLSIDYSDYDKPRYKLSYTDLMKQIDDFRSEQSRLFTAGQNDSIRKEIIQVCQDSLFNYMVKDVFPAWYGTEWDFNGISQVPKKGKYPIVNADENDKNRIACGYFLTMPVYGMGFKIERYKIAWQNPEGIVKNFANAEDILYIQNFTTNKLKKQLKKKGKGIYVVGLGPVGHVGFIVYDGKEYFRFVHSSYDNPPFSVTSDTFESNNPLTRAKEVILGKTLNSEMIEKWLLGEKLKLVE